MSTSNFENAKVASIAANKELIDKLSGFPHIHGKIEHLWGTKELDTYLNGLLFAGREGRQGFPKEIAKTIFNVMTANDAFIEEVFK